MGKQKNYKILWVNFKLPMINFLGALFNTFRLLKVGTEVNNNTELVAEPPFFTSRFKRFIYLMLIYCLYR